MLLFEIYSHATVWSLIIGGAGGAVMCALMQDGGVVPKGTAYFVAAMAVSFGCCAAFFAIALRRVVRFIKSYRPSFEDFARIRDYLEPTLREKIESAILDPDSDRIRAVE